MTRQCLFAVEISCHLRGRSIDASLGVKKRKAEKVYKKSGDLDQVAGKHIFS